MLLINEYQENRNNNAKRIASLKTKLQTKLYQIVRNVNAKHCVTALILLTLGTIIYYTHYVDNSPFIRLVAISLF